MKNLTLEVALIAAILSSPVAGQADEVIKLGVLKATGTVGPIYLAAEKGYFAAEGLKAEIALLDLSNPAAVVSGSVDFQIGALSAAFYNVAGQGALRIIAGGAHEHPSFQANGYVVSNQAFSAGLKSYGDFSGHSIGIPATGGPPEYSIALLADKYDFAFKSLKIVALQSFPNVASSVAGGRIDVGVVVQPVLLPLVQSGGAKLLGWAGDETPYQIGAVWTASSTADHQRETVERFLRALKKGIAAYHDAFTSSDETRRDGPRAPEVLGLIAKNLGLSADLVKLGIGYIDPQARLDVKDVLHQIAWYKSQGMVKPEVDGSKIIDARYVVPLPEK